jgi:Fe-S cluster assembly protein SufD
MSTVVSNGIATGFRRIRAAEPEWLYQMRRSAWESYTELPMPDRVKHLWRYTRPENFVLQDVDRFLSSAPNGNPGDRSNGVKINNGFSARGIIISGSSPRMSLTQNLKDAGVLVRNLQSSVLVSGELTEPYLGRLVNAESGKFESANLALFTDGFLVYVPDNTVVDKPILLETRTGTGSSVSRLLVIVGKNSELTLIDSYSSGEEDDGSIYNGAAEIFVEEGSRLRYVTLQNRNKDCRSFVTQRVRAAKEANVLTVFGTFGGSVTKVDAGTILAGRGAQSRMYGIAFADTKQHFDHHTVHDHVSSDTYSNLDVKVVLKNKALSAYTGLIRIDETAENCEAYQENRNLLLDKGTKAETIPELEILNDQVSCSHGATVGPLDPEMVFYLRSRGFSKEEATHSIVHGFVEPTIQLIPEDLRETIHRAVTTKLEAN